MPIPDFDALERRLAQIQDMARRTRTSQPGAYSPPRQAQMTPEAQAMYLMMQGKAAPHGPAPYVGGSPLQTEQYRNLSKTIPLPASVEDVQQFAPKTYQRYLRGDVSYEQLAGTLQRSKAERGIKPETSEPTLLQKAGAIARAIPEGAWGTVKDLSVIGSGPVQAALQARRIGGEYTEDDLRAIGQNVLRNKPLLRLLQDQGYFHPDSFLLRHVAGGPLSLKPDDPRSAIAAATALIMSQQHPESAEVGKKMKTEAIQTAALGLAPGLGLEGKAGQIFEKALFRPAAAGSLAGAAQYAVTGSPQESMRTGATVAGLTAAGEAGGALLGKALKARQALATATPPSRTVSVPAPTRPPEVEAGIRQDLERGLAAMQQGQIPNPTFEFTVNKSRFRYDLARDAVDVYNPNDNSWIPFKSWESPKGRAELEAALREQHPNLPVIPASPGAVVRERAPRPESVAPSITRSPVQPEPPDWVPAGSAVREQAQLARKAKGAVAQYRASTQVPKPTTSTWTGHPFADLVAPEDVAIARTAAGERAYAETFGDPTLRRRIEMAQETAARQPSLTTESVPETVAPTVELNAPSAATPEAPPAWRQPENWAPAGFSVGEWQAILNQHRTRLEGLVAAGKIRSRQDVMDALGQTAGYLDRIKNIKAAQMREIEQQVTPAVQEASGLTNKRDLFSRLFRGEDAGGEQLGQIDPRYGVPLGLGALGAVGGLLSGGTPEERAKRAAFYGAIGLATPFMLPGIGVLLREAKGYLTPGQAANLSQATQGGPLVIKPKNPLIEGVKSFASSPLSQLEARGMPIDQAIQKIQQTIGQQDPARAQRAIGILQQIKQQGFDRVEQAAADTLLSAVHLGERDSAAAELELRKLLDKANWRQRRQLANGRARALAEGRVQPQTPLDHALLAHMVSTGNVITDTAGIEPLANFFPRNIQYGQLGRALQDDQIGDFARAVQREYPAQFSTFDAAREYAESVKKALITQPVEDPNIAAVSEGIPSAHYGRLEYHREFKYLPPRYESLGRKYTIIDDSNNLADLINHYRRGFLTGHMWRAFGRNGEVLQQMAGIIPDQADQDALLHLFRQAMGGVNNKGLMAAEDIIPTSGQIAIRGEPQVAKHQATLMTANAIANLGAVSIPNQMISLAQVLGQTGYGATSRAILPGLVEVAPLINRTTKDIMLGRIMRNVLSDTETVARSGALSASGHIAPALGVSGTARAARLLQDVSVGIHGATWADKLTRAIGAYANILDSNALLDAAASGSAKAAQTLENKAIPEVAEAIRAGRFTQDQLLHIAQQGGNFIPRPDNLYVPAFAQTYLGRWLFQFGRPDFAEAVFGRKLVKDAIANKNPQALIRFTSGYFLLAAAIAESQRLMRGESPPAMEDRAWEMAQKIPVLGRFLGNFRQTSGAIDPQHSLTQAVLPPALSTVARAAGDAYRGVQAVKAGEPVPDSVKRDAMRWMLNIFGGGTGALANRAFPTQRELERQAEIGAY